MKILSAKVYIHIKIGNKKNHFTIKERCACPACKSTNLKRNGHDTTVSGHPRHLVCQDCGKSFYPHTSYHATNFVDDLKQDLAKSIDGGYFSPRRLKIVINTSDATSSRLMQQIIALVNASARAKHFWAKKFLGHALFVDETFLSIGKKKWYLVAIVNEHGHVLAFDIVQHRDVPTILELINKAGGRLRGLFTHLISDGFRVYQKVAKLIGRDIVHVEHIHERPHDKVIIYQIHHEPDKIVTKIFATTVDILVKGNLFIAQVSEVVEKKGKGKPGRKKGTKNKKKTIDETNDAGKVPEPNAKEPIVMVDDAHGSMNEQEIVVGATSEVRANAANPPDSHGKTTAIVVLQYQEQKRMKAYRDGEPRVFVFHAKAHLVTGFNGERVDGCEVFQDLLPLFEGLNITTNLIEQLFAVAKHVISFRGCRNVQGWKDILLAYFAIRYYPEILEAVLNELHVSSRTGARLMQASHVEIAAEA